MRALRRSMQFFVADRNAASVARSSRPHRSMPAAACRLRRVDVCAIARPRRSIPRKRTAEFRRAFACALFAGAAGAQAQMAGSATLVSDYRFRGTSFSDERPAAQIALSYDHESGAYIGAFASNVRLAAEEGSGVQA